MHTVLASVPGMNAIKGLKLITILSLSALVLGFSGNEKYVELEGYLNGRSSRAFRSIDKNVVSVLNKGTRGEILESKKMVSGNYGLRIKVLSGSQAGKSYWVYYNVKNPDLALYETAPQSWGTKAPEQRASFVERARGTEALRDTHAITPPPPARQAAPAKPSTPISAADAREALAAIAGANARAKNVGAPPKAPAQANCPTCRDAVPAKQVSSLPLGRERRGMDNQCSNIMSGAGVLGPIGKNLVEVMTSPSNKAYYTANNSLGALCPRFNSLTEAQRIQAWTWFWTSLAQEESGCQTNKPHPTHDKRGRRINPNEGYGLWAFEKDRNLRRARGSECSDIGTAAGQAKCAVSIMTKTQLSKRRSAGPFAGSYWGPVRRSQGQLIPHMERFGLCF